MTLSCAATLAALFTAPAGAAGPVALGGSPLTVYVGELGQLQGRRDVDAENIFFAPHSQLGDAGFFLSFPPVTASGAAPPQQGKLSGTEFGFSGSAGPFIPAAGAYTPRSQGAVTGAGTDAGPFTQVTTYGADGDKASPTTDDALITQTTSYVTGKQSFNVKWEVANTSGAPLRFKAIAGADFYFEGSDVGTGIFTQGPPRFVGGTNADTGRSGGFVEAAAPTLSLPWSHYQALRFTSGDGDNVWGKVQTAGDAATPSLDDTVVGEPVDNAGAVEWDQYLDPARTLAPGAVATFELVVRTALPAALQFDRSNAGSPQGVPITFTVTAKDTADVPFAGRKLLSAITGANPGTQAATIAADGTATVTDPGTNAGADTVVSFVDLNNNGTREAGEPQGSALATFVDQTPPSCTVKVTGDRPVSSGGQGKPLVITVNCDSPATVSTASTLLITPPAATKQSGAKARAETAAKKRHKSKKKAKKRKKVTVKLPATTTLVQPGAASPISIKIPASVTRKYPGATAKATVTVTAVDGARNVATTTAAKTVKIAKPKAKAKKKSKAKHKR